MKDYKITYYNFKDLEEKVTVVTAPTKDKAKSILLGIIAVKKITKTQLNK